MNTPLSWIKDYVPDLDCTDQEYADRMTLTGTKVETVEVLDKNLEKIVVARLESVEKHPDAEKLVVCRVNVGDVKADGVDENGSVQIVTGAPNITPDRIGCLVPVVLDGGRVAGGHDGGPLPENGIPIISLVWRTPVATMLVRYMTTCFVIICVGSCFVLGTAPTQHRLSMPLISSKAVPVTKNHSGKCCLWKVLFEG